MAYKKQQIVNFKETILDRLIQGESLNTMCKEKDLPSSRVVFRWLNKDEEFCRNYTRARQQQALFYAEKIQSELEELPNDSTREQIQIANLKIESYKWIASKLLPKVFGNMTTQNNLQINTSEPITGMRIINTLPE